MADAAEDQTVGSESSPRIGFELFYNSNGPPDSTSSSEVEKEQLVSLRLHQASARVRKQASMKAPLQVGSDLYNLSALFVVQCACET